MTAATIFDGVCLPGATIERAEDGRCCYLLRPGPAGRTLVLLPPLGEGWSTWARVWPALGGLGRCVAFGPPETTGTPPAIEAWLTAIETVVPNGSLVLAGASVGALAALLAARRQPARVASVICLSLRPDLGTLDYLEPLFSPRGVDDVDRIWRMTHFGGPALPPSAVDRLLEHWRTPAVKAVLRSVTGLHVGQQTTRVAALGIPVTFIHGADDALLAAGSPAEGDDPPGVRRYRLKDCAHYPQKEQAAACAALMVQAANLERTPRARRPWRPTTTLTRSRP